MDEEKLASSDESINSCHTEQSAIMETAGSSRFRSCTSNMEGNGSELCFDSLCYISDHTGFYGTIKNSPSDFIVIEINTSGELVTDSTDSKVKENSNPEDIIQIKRQKTDTGTSETNTTPSAAGFVKEPERKNTEEANEALEQLECGESLYNLLNPFLGLDVQETLNDFASSVKSSFESPAEGNEPCELSLGPIPNKEDRAIIHSAVRQTFPFLVTFTKSTELLVKPNPDYRELCRLTSKEEADKFFLFLDAKAKNSRFTFQPDVCKEHRTSVHHFISRKFGKQVETKSFSEKGTDGLRRVSITVRFREKGGSSGKRQRTEEHTEMFTEFTLEKKNLETLEAISYLSSLLGVLPSDFSYAGIKDKKAITYQTMTVKKVTPERLLELKSKLEKKCMKIHNVFPTKRHLHLGQLMGNHFTILVRDIRNHTSDPAEDLYKKIEEAAHNIKVRGFVNYYGPQRFGKGQNMQSHKIGLALLKEEMVLAVKLFFTPEDCDDPVNKAKQYFLDTEDAKSALALMPEFKVRERMMLRALNRYGISHEGCIRGWLSIPHSMRIFYTHAYCSKVWNEAASYRIATYGMKVVEGDLVYRCKENHEISALGDRVHTVIATEEADNIYSIDQVVLPMPGYSIVYPSNQVGQWYKETLAKAGLESCKFRVSSLQMNIPGCYRHILKYPRNFLHELLVKDNHIQDQCAESETHQPSKALKLSFELDSSCYATVCLRELMKCNF
ncbi:pseudouridylate synthase PUS7L [Gastrophryne carolinensis]